MLVQFECPLCGEYNQVCLEGSFELRGFRCHGCGSKLDIIAISVNNFPDVHESLEDSGEECLEELENGFGISV
ncbi:hypothetical protein EOM09_00445 [bacterium]|nr:hypothetical protein [bacterium]